VARWEFITLLGGAAAALPLSARAQQPGTPVIGFLSSRSPDESKHLVNAFRAGLHTGGYVEGESVAIEYRWAEGEYDRLPALAIDLVRRAVAVLVTTGGEPSALAAKSAASRSIIFAVAESVKSAVAGLSRPGGTPPALVATTAAPEAGARLPASWCRGGRYRHVINPNTQRLELNREVQEAARVIGRQVRIAHATNDRELEPAFATLVQQRAAALLVSADPFFDTRRDRIVALAAQFKLPAIYQFRDYAVAGGLMSYGISITDGYRQVGIYTGRVLKGTKPADLPIYQSIKFEAVVNLKTAKALGLSIPDSVLVLADDVIE
jgi:putative ABC transport system substrate-binding protein